MRALQEKFANDQIKIIKSKHKHHPSKKYWLAKDIISLIIPKEISYLKKNDESDDILILNGKLLKGKCTKAVTGTSSGSLIHIIQNDLGQNATKEFLNSIQGLAGGWLLKKGFSVGIGDCIPDINTEKKINNIVRKAKANVKNIINARSFALTIHKIV